MLLLGLLFAALWVFCLIDVVMTPGPACRNLPKVVWFVIVLLLFEIGALTWLLAGRPRAGAFNTRGGAGAPGRAAGPRGTRGLGESSFGPVRRAPGTQRPTNPDDDPEFLAILQARAEEQRRAREAEPPDSERPS